MTIKPSNALKLYKYTINDLNNVRHNYYDDTDVTPLIKNTAKMRMCEIWKWPIHTHLQ